MERINKKRREFLVASATTTLTVGTVCAAIPFFSSMSPDKGVLSESTLEVKLDKVPEGGVLTVKWRGAPIFIKHRTAQEIHDAKATKLNLLPDPEDDSKRVKPGNDKWLVLIGICTHLGCVPISNKGDFKGWFCPCHGSHYDTSGRIREGPAPKNLKIPPYRFIDQNTILIGEEV